MSSIPLDRALEGLRALELDGNVIEAFSFDGTSSWVAIKNALYEVSHAHLDVARMHMRDFLNIAGGAIAVRSIANWVWLAVRRNPAPLFAGAGSGLCEYAGEVLDSYLPEEVAKRPGVPRENLVYFLSATHLHDFERHKNYLVHHHAIIFSLLISPLRGMMSVVIAWLINLTSPRLCASACAVSDRMASYGVNVSSGYVLRQHARFVAGYILYRAFLAPLRITAAFIVSPYSYSDLVAALKRRKIPVAEIQHGVVGAAHRGYNYVARSRLLPVPDSVHVYDEFWRSELIAGGYYRRDQIVIAKRLKYEMARNEAGPDYPPYIVFTGQGLRSEAEKFVSDYVASDTGLHLIYVPHPNESAPDIAALIRAADGDSRVHILSVKPCTTERLIIDGLAHVSVSSSCHFDALYYKKRTYVFDVIADNVMRYFADKTPDSIIVIKTVAELLTEIASHGAEPDRNSQERAGAKRAAPRS